jgi:hypothetical protein
MKTAAILHFFFETNPPQQKNSVNSDSRGVNSLQSPPLAPMSGSEALKST